LGERAEELGVEESFPPLIPVAGYLVEKGRRSN